MRRRNVASMLFLAALVVRCASFKEGDTPSQDDGGPGGPGNPPAAEKDGSTVHSDGGDGGPRGTGPGPHGALPSGYCCTTNDECRYRNCIAYGGTKLCADRCTNDTQCQGGPLSSHCVVPTSDTGSCQPTATTVSCVPADQFRTGIKELGACCDPKSDQKHGIECAGGRCGSWREVSNPYICGQVCDGIDDCPGTYDCLNTSDGYSLCAPKQDTYTCTP